MKKINLSLVAIVIAVLTFSACSSSDIVGEWKVKTAELTNADEVFEKYLAQMPGIDQETADTMKAQMQEGLKGELEGSVIEFTADNKFIADGSQEGTWEYGEDKTVIVYGEDKKETMKCTIKSNSGSKLELEMLINDSEVSMEIALELEKTDKKSEKKSEE